MANKTQNKLRSGIPSILLRKPALAPTVMRVCELGLTRQRKVWGCEREDRVEEEGIAALCLAEHTIKHKAI